MKLWKQYASPRPSRFFSPPPPEPTQTRQNGTGRMFRQSAIYFRAVAPRRTVLVRRHRTLSPVTFCVRFEPLGSSKPIRTLCVVAVVGSPVVHAERCRSTVGRCAFLPVYWHSSWRSPTKRSNESAKKRSSDYRVRNELTQQTQRQSAYKMFIFWGVLLAVAFLLWSVVKNSDRH